MITLVKSLTSLVTTASIAFFIGNSAQANDLLEHNPNSSTTSAATSNIASGQEGALLSFNDIGGLTMADYTNSGLAGLKFEMLDVMTPKTNLFSEKDKTRFATNRTYIQADLSQSDIKLNNGLKHFNLASFTISNNQLIKGEKSALFGEKVLKSVTGLTLVK